MFHWPTENCFNEAHLKPNEKVDCANLETEDIKKNHILNLKNIVTKKKFNE